jgi:hypothetical protein
MPRRTPAASNVLTAPKDPTPPIGTMSGLAGAQSGHSASIVPSTRVFRMVAAERGGQTRGMKTALEKDFTENQARPLRFGKWRAPNADL